IGHVALPAVDGDHGRDGAAAADLDHVAEVFRIGRLAAEGGVPDLALPGRPVEQFHRAVDRRPFLVAGDKQRYRALEAAFGCDVAGGGGDETGDAALHVDSAATVHLAIVDVGREGG